MNLEQAVFMVRRCYPDHVIVAVDASVGRSRACGLHYPGEKARSGQALGLQGTAGGGRHLYHQDCRGCGSCDPLMLQSVRLSVRMRMADYICDSVRRRWFRKLTILSKSFIDSMTQTDKLYGHFVV